MPIACSSAATACASKRRRNSSLLDRVQPLMERSHPSSGRSATPADIIRNGRPTSIGTGGRRQSECPADIIGIRTLRDLAEPVERVLSQVRAVVEHPFHIVKNLFRHKKLRYRGLNKNTAQLHTLFALANLVIIKKTLLVQSRA